MSSRSPVVRGLAVHAPSSFQLSLAREVSSFPLRRAAFQLCVRAFRFLLSEFQLFNDRPVVRCPVVMWSCNAFLRPKSDTTCPSDARGEIRVCQAGALWKLE